MAADRNCGPALDAGEVRVLRSHRNRAVKSRRKEMSSTKLMAAPRIVIDGIAPSVDGGRFAAKRIIGEHVTIEADVFTDGHDILVVELLWRAVDEKEWRRIAMQSLNNDRWQVQILPERIGRYEFTIEAWLDRYATLCRDIQIKRAAGDGYRGRNCRGTGAPAKNAEDRLRMARATS